MKKHFFSIRTFSKKGKVQSIFNFCYNQDLNVLIPKIVDQILQLQFNRFKLNYSFAYILRNINNEELRYYHTSYNNSLMMPTARLISNRQELIEFFNMLAEESFFDKINRPDSKWKVVDIPNITFYVNHIKDAPLGAPIFLPDYIKTDSRFPDFELYCGVYQCVHCDKLWDHSGNYYRHTESCTTTVCEVFPGGIHKYPATIFENLEKIGIVVPHCDHHFPFFACYDFEAYFSKKQISNSSMLTLDACHIP